MRFWIKFGLLALVLLCLTGCAHKSVQKPEPIAETLQPVQELEAAEKPETEPEAREIQPDAPEADFLTWVALRAETTAEEGVPEEELLTMLVACECGLVNDGFTFDDPGQLRAGQLYLLFLLWTDYPALETCQSPDDGQFYFSEAFIRRTLDCYLQGYAFDITACDSYDPDCGMIVTPIASGFGGNRNMQLTDRRKDGDLTIYTADFYAADTEEIAGNTPFARKEYVLRCEDGGFTFVSARFVPLPVDADMQALRARLTTSLRVQTGQESDDPAVLFAALEAQDPSLFDLPDFSTETAPDRDELSRYLYERLCRSWNEWPQQVTRAALGQVLARTFLPGTVDWEDGSTLYFDYADGIYTRTVWDWGGVCVRWLEELTVNPDGSYAAVFRTVSFAEGEFDTTREAVAAALRDQTREPDGRQKLVFRLSADGNLLFLSCRRTGDGVDGLAIDIPAQYQDSVRYDVTAHCAMEFFDRTARDNGHGGTVWGILVYTPEEFEQTYGRSADEWTITLPGPEQRMLGRTAEHIYVLDLPSGMSYDPDNAAEAASYQACVQSSGAMLESLAELNAEFTLNPLLPGESLNGIVFS